MLTAQPDAVDISLNSAPNTTFTVEIFTSPGCDPLGHGEGKVWVGALPMLTNGSGDATFAGFPVPAGLFITATATDPAGNTSEFSACVQTPSDNQPPLANAGPDQEVPTGAEVQLDSSGSSDPDNDPLTYLWILNVRPAGSSAVLSAANEANPTFVADVEGTYIAQLVVNDGLINGQSDTVTILTGNRTPVANAGPDQSNLALSATVNLNGGGSSDPDSDDITFSWSFVLRPSGSTAQLINPTSQTPSFVIDTLGLYRIALTVSDGQASSVADTVDIVTVNQPPVANAGGDQTVLVGATVNVNGNGSSDPDNNPLTYTWNLVTRPAGSTATLSNPNVVNPSFVADVTGIYTVRLIVNDTIVDSAPDDVTITVNPNAIALALLNTPLIGAGRQATLQITLPSAAPAGGALVTVVSNNTNVVTVGPPNTTTIAQGATVGQVVLNGIASGSTTVDATAPGYDAGYVVSHGHAECAHDASDG